VFAGDHDTGRLWPGGRPLRSRARLARLWANRGKPEHGRTMLRPILEQFVEGRDTADPLTAARLLEELGGIT